MPDSDESSVKKMAELLRRGATMLAQACPQCGSPLMQVDDDIYCASCDRRIVFSDSEEETQSHAVRALLPELRETLLKKLRALNEVVDKETDTEALLKLANLMVLLLQALHKLENMSEQA